MFILKFEYVISTLFASPMSFGIQLVTIKKFMHINRRNKDIRNGPLSHCNVYPKIHPYYILKVEVYSGLSQKANNVEPTWFQS